MVDPLATALAGGPLIVGGLLSFVEFIVSILRTYVPIVIVAAIAGASIGLAVNLLVYAFVGLVTRQTSRRSTAG